MGRTNQRALIRCNLLLALLDERFQVLKNPPMMSINEAEQSSSGSVGTHLYLTPDSGTPNQNLPSHYPGYQYSDQRCTNQDLAVEQC